ncbi:hypothetical protein [Streptomyces griseorubiginosus]|uniref:hypothetical protein n=1 Tax=Streptomyces griseorubiginosus TaxID=67304 RepID=UPI001AD60DF9|nr:hypothetical protein [Streptomyces griseorubiginosus]MBO4252450.1 hypothetical protein [Streptomyces griseorubiginosus]
MTAHKERRTRHAFQDCPYTPDVACPCGDFVECRAIGEVAVLIDRVAAQSGLAPQDLLQSISDEALAALYLRCVADVRTRAATVTRDDT